MLYTRRLTGGTGGETESECTYLILYNDTSFLSLLFGVFQIFCMVYMIWYLKQNERAARISHGVGKEVIVLPVYKSLLKLVALAGVVVGVFRVGGFYHENVLYMTIKWMVFRFFTEGLAVFLMHNGVGRRAAIRSTLISLSWTLLSGLGPFVVFVFYGFYAFTTFSLVTVGLLGLFYAVNWLAPTRVLHRRPAMILLARFYAWVFFLLFFSIFFLKYNSDPSGCTVNILTALWDWVQPMLVFRTIILESLFWQGSFLHYKVKFTADITLFTYPFVRLVHQGSC
jgi:hypothetical protein